MARLKKLRSNEVRWILFPRVIDFLGKTIPVIEKDKVKYENLKLQFKDFIVDSKLLSETSQITLGRKIKDKICDDGKPLFSKISKCFSSELLAVIVTFDNNANNISNN